MAWLRADDVFAAADREADALNPAPWLERRQGPLRKPDEGQIRIKKRHRVSPDERLRHLAAKIREAENALAHAEPDADLWRLRCRVAGLRAYAVAIRNGRR